MKQVLEQEPEDSNRKQTIREKLDDILGLEASPENTEVVHYTPAEVRPSGNPEKDLEDDFNTARSTIHNLIEKGNELVDNANFFAKEKQDSRSVESAAMAQKEARDNAMALINLHKTKREIEKISNTQSSGDTNISQTAVFIGSTGELLKQMKELNAGGFLNDALRTITVEAEPIALPLNTDEKKN